MVATTTVAVVASVAAMTGPRSRAFSCVTETAGPGTQVPCTVFRRRCSHTS